MTDTDKSKHLQDVDRVLADVREHLEYQHDKGNQYELRALQLLLEVTRAMHSERDLRTLITLILDSALSFIEAERAFLMLLDENDRPRFKLGRSYGGNYLAQDAFTISSSIVDEALDTRKPLIVADAQQDARFSGSQSIADMKLRTVMAAPLRCDGECLLGLIYLDSPRPMARYSKHHLNVLSSLAEQAAVALNNAQKFETHTG